MKRILNLIYLCFGLFLFMQQANGQCYSIITLQQNTECVNNTVTLPLRLDSPNGGGGNACVIIEYTDTNIGETSQSFSNLRTPRDVTITNVDCDAPIAFIPKTAGNCNGTDCADTIKYPSVNVFINPSLPIELGEFQVKNANSGTVLIQWQTLSEIENDHFEIQKRYADAEWETIGLVEGQGNSYETVEYEFTDRKPIPGINYYRIVNVDYSGRKNYSVSRTIHFKDNNREINVFPNPATDKINIRGTLKNAKIELLSIDGKVINTITLSDTRTDYAFEIKDLEKGSYLVRVVQQNDQQVFKVVKN